MRCDGPCGTWLGPDDPVIEVERTFVYCTFCALTTRVSNLVGYTDKPEVLLS